jgi:hypothetical protein
VGRTRKSASEDDRAKALERLRDIRARQAALKREEKDIKEDLLPFIKDLGTFPYLDEHGVKRWAYFSDSEMTILDIAELERCIEEGLIRESILELVAPRKADTELLKQALQAGRIPKTVIRRCISIEHSRETIRFGNENEEEQ